MITPEFLRQVLEDMEDDTSWLNVYLLTRIANRIASSFDAMQANLLIPATINDLHKLIDAGMVYEDIVQVMEKALPEIAKDVRVAFLESADELMDYSLRLQNDINHVRSILDKDASRRALAQIAEESNMSIPKVVTILTEHERSQAARTQAEPPKEEPPKSAQTGQEEPKREETPEEPKQGDGRGENPPTNANEMAPEDKKIVEDAYNRTNEELHNLTHTTAAAGQADYINACDEAFMKVQSGMSIDQAVMEAIDSLAAKGITSVQFANSRSSIETSVARAVRTGINQANAELVLRRCSELGVNHVLVSAHLGARVTKKQDYTNDAHWQGKVYHLDWNKPELAKYKQESAFEEYEDEEVFPDFVDECGWGNILGICGINCRHSFQVFFPGINTIPDYDINDEENKKRYDAEQKARAMERAIRQTKRRIQALEELDSEEASNKLSELQGKLNTQWDDYVLFCQENNIPVNNLGVYVPKVHSGDSINEALKGRNAEKR